MSDFNFQQEFLNLKSNLFNYALHLTGNPDDANDLFQDTSERALSKKDSFKNDVNLKAWLCTVMHNIFINGYKKTLQAHNFVDMDSPCLISDESFLSRCEDSSADSGVGIEEIYKAMNSMNGDEKIIMGLFVSGYSYNEISKKLRMPIGSVKSKIYKSRVSLKSRLEE